MIKVKTTVFFITILVLIGCTGNKIDLSSGNCENLVIDPATAASVPLSRVFSLKRIFKLQVNNELIGNISNIYLKKDFIIIYADNLYLYDYDGNFIKKIGRNGKGPGEYLSIHGVECNKLGFFIMDRSQQKIIHLNDQGRYIRDYKIGLFGEAYSKWNNINLIYTGNEINKYNNKLFIFDNDFNYKMSFLKISENEHRFVNFYDKTNFYNYKDSIRFLCSFDNNIYNLDNKGYVLRKRYKVDFGKYTIPEDYFNRQFSDSRDFMMNLRASSYAYRIMGFYENDHEIIFMFWYRDKMLLAIYNKRDHTSVIADNLFDDIVFKGLNIKPADEYFSYYFKDNSVYFVLFPFQIKDYTDKMKEELTDDEWKNYEKSSVYDAFKNINEEDNPLIIEFSIK